MMVVLFLLLSCAVSQYEHGYDYGCEFVWDMALEQGLQDGQSCITNTPSVLCASPDRGVAGIGWEAGCYDCTVEAYEAGQAEGLLECDAT